MYCSNCGAEIAGQFCSKCGVKIDDKKSNDSGLVFQQTRSVVLTKPGAQTSGTAIAAIVCSFFIPLLGLILGLIARNEIKNSNGEKSGDGLANAAIVFSIIFMIVYFLAALAWIGFMSSVTY